MAFKPHYLKNVKFVLGDFADGDAYQCQLRSVVITPEAEDARVKTLCPEGRYSEVDDPEWSVELGYLNGNVATGDDPGALADYLMEHHGEKLPFFFEPVLGVGKGYQGVLTVKAGALGGEQGAFSEQSVTLPVDGQVTSYDATAGPGEGMAGTGGTESMGLDGGETSSTGDEYPEF